MIPALVSTAAMSVGTIAVALGAHAAVPVIAYALGLAALLVRIPRIEPGARAGRWLVAVAVVALVAHRHLFVSSSGLAPDHVLALAVVAGALGLPRGRPWDAIGVAGVLATYAVVALILIGVKPYHSDAVVSAHGAADLVLAGRHPYEAFDLVAQLARFGLPPEYATPLEDGSRVRSLQYPALAFLVPAPFVALGLTDIRLVYLAEVLATFALVLAAVAPRLRALALAACVGNVVVLDQFVLAGVDPLFALCLVAAWLTRRHRASAVLLGLAVASRQQAWLVAPFVLLVAWQQLGGREALARAAIVAGVAVAIHLPFLVTSPLAVIGGLLDSALQPHEPWGIGPSALAAAIGLPVPRQVLLALAGGSFVLALWAFATGRVRADRTLVIPLMPLWLGWRALQSYFAFLPLFFALASDRSDERIDARSGSPGARPRLSARSARPGDER